ncbi:hypothetical protein D7X74_06780 [Corallococcus sp. CA047B]|uniref:hypothetical protein n=1 Tax=Corallococcus sp. CA047B TaxID=2316729 RepID=UPI000EA29716|nr:hypothetical protein [Corallococcus sp. CA047B]RKH19428.1 hypothetical protein D7X74_06780 [Corallococcus sp. CA047B]
MSRRFTRTEDAALRTLLGAASTTDPAALEDRAPVPFREVQRILALPELPHLDLLGDDTWLLGGRILRWLTGEMRDGGDTGDYDLFCASLEALERTARRMLATGYTPCRRQGATQWGPWLMDRLRGRDDHAPCAGAVFEEGALQERLRLRRFPDGREMYALELHSPEGHLLQLVHIPALFAGRGDPIRHQLAFTDLSICQFLLDGRLLHAGPHAWVDLFQRRVRVVKMVRPGITAQRLLKYAGRGFWPDADSVRTVHRALRQR